MGSRKLGTLLFCGESRTLCDPVIVIHQFPSQSSRFGSHDIRFMVASLENGEVGSIGPYLLSQLKSMGLSFDLAILNPSCSKARSKEVHWRTNSSGVPVLADGFVPVAKEK